MPTHVTVTETQTLISTENMLLKLHGLKQMSRLRIYVDDFDNIILR